MPKVINTKKQRVRALLKKLQDGPALYPVPYQINYSPVIAEGDVRLWLRTWIIPEVKALLPKNLLPSPPEEK